MKIETIYNVGDIVWTMSNNKAVECKCVGIDIAGSNKVDDLAWLLDFNELPTFWGGLELQCARRFESDLFWTKEDLIKSIFKTEIIIKLNEN